MSEIIDYINTQIDKLDTAMEDVHPSSKDHTRYSSQQTALINVRERFTDGDTDE